ncbi:MAG TPA: OFA family MFS transporter [Pirellulales bacterium]|jgi:OFA family oxalate/formate antiporter-like MFS transporter|nr:OFA family MFS transporter [Pirellulales bacterium]
MNHRRWLVVLGALLVQPCLGAIYAWGVFVTPLQASRSELTVTLSAKLLGVDPEKHDQLVAEYLALKAKVANAHGTARDAAKGELTHFLSDVVPERLHVSDEVWARHYYGYTNTEAQSIYATGIMVFSLMMIFAGRWQDRVGPRRVAMTGGVLLAAGYALAALAGPDFSVVLCGIGLLGGAGIGLAYVCPVAACVKWFPDLRGLITGLAVAGFGGGAYLFINLAGKWGDLIAREGVSGTWLTYAVVFSWSITLGSSLLRNPPVGWRPAGWSAPQLALGTVAEHEWLRAEAVRTRTFWLLWIAFLFAGGCGMMVISSLKDFGTREGGLSVAEAQGALGLLALSNAAGRITWGWVSQWLSARRTLVIVSLLQAIMLLALIEMGGKVWTLEIAACWVGFHFGGNMSLFPLITAEYYGTRNLGANYGLIFTGYGVGGLVVPIFAGQVWDRTHSYFWAFVPAAAGCLLAMALAMAMRRPDAPATAEIA